MPRWSREKRFFSVTLDDFLKQVNALYNTVARVRNDCSFQVFACEDGETYNFSQVTILTPEVTEVLANRRVYDISEVDQALVERAFSLCFVAKSITAGNSFMVALTWDIHSDPSRLLFYYQSVNEYEADAILDLSLPGFLWKIGDGYPKPSQFNWYYVRKYVSSRESA